MKKIPDNSPTWNAWLNGGVLAGQKARPQGRVTVQPNYHLELFSPLPSVFPWGPVRWWQSSTGQTEVEIPNVLSFDYETSIDSDAGTFTVTFENTAMDNFGVGDPTSTDYGHPGFMTPDRGTRTNRWGYTTNQWINVLTANSLIRIYSGFGGDPSDSIENQVNAGHLVLSFVGLTDEPVISADGTFKLSGRSMAKLLIDQQVFASSTPQTSLVPMDLYPVSFFATGVEETTEPVVQYGHGAGGVDTGRYVVDIQHNMTGDGYWLVGSDGGVYSYGNVAFYGAPIGTLQTGFQVVGMAAIEGLFPNAEGRNTPVAGYWVAAAGLVGGAWTCYVYAYGAHQFGGHIPTGSPVVAIEPMKHGHILVDSAGQVYTSSGGGATYLGGSPSLVSGDLVVGAAVRPQGDGYWLVTAGGRVYAYGAAPYLGNSTSGRPTVDIASSSSGNGYYLVDDIGGVFTFGDSQFWGSEAGGPTLNDPMKAITVPPTKNPAIPGGQGYWLAAGDGGVFTFTQVTGTLTDASGTHNIDAVNFWGSMPGVFTFTPVGNYIDLIDIVSYFLLWAGFNFFDGTNAYVYGNLEGTGTHSPDILDATVWDKKSVLAAIKTVASIVGYLVYVGSEGEAHVHSPNWWQSGNVLPNGTRTDYIPVVDERTNLTAYQRSNPDKDIRSEIIITSDNQIDSGGFIPGTVTASYIPSTSAVLKGMVNPAMWVNSFFVNQAEITLMAQLVALHIFFRSQLGSVTMLANPFLEIDDQVQIMERQTFETNCVDEETQILTQRGWLNFKDVSVGDKALAINPGTDRSEWILIEDVYKARVVDHPMVSMEGKRHSSLTTLDHRWWITQTRGRKREFKWEWRTSENLNSESRIPRSAPPGHCPTVQSWSDALVELVAWYLAEGNDGETGGGAGISQSRTANPENCLGIEKVLTTLFGPVGTRAKYGKWNRTLRPNGSNHYRLGKEASAILRQVAPNKNPRMDFLCELTEDQLNLFISICMDGDGNRQESCHRFCQNEGDLLDSFEAVCVMAGIPFGTKSGTSKSGLQRTVNQSIQRFVYPARATNTNKKNWKSKKTVSYTGWVWCPQLERHFNWAARRHGTVYFTGNTHYVRTIHTSMDLKSGQFIQTLTTNILSSTIPFSVTKLNPSTGTITSHRP